MRRNYYNRPISKTFIQAFPKFKAGQDEEAMYFWEAWKSSPFYDSTFTEAEMKDIYNHLLAEYYNCNFIYLDDLGITLNVFHIIEDYYPNVKERLKLVKDLRDLSIDNFKKSGLQITSQGTNPKVATDMDELIDLVDSQSANFQLKSEEQAIKAKFLALYDGVMEEFIKRFEKLFTPLYNGLYSYIYVNQIEDDDDEI